MAATQTPVRHATGRDGSYLRARCHATDPDFVTKTFTLVTCERCLYIADVETRAKDLRAANDFGKAAKAAIEAGLSEEAVRESACVAAHFGLRLYPEIAA